jgi:uncharacterized Zn finger protein
MSDCILTCPRCGRKDQQGRHLRGRVNVHEPVWERPFISVVVDCPICGWVDASFTISPYMTHVHLVTPRRKDQDPELSFPVIPKEIPAGTIFVKDERPV